MARFKLKLTRLDFVSPVDSPAQETAKVLLIKREGQHPSLEGSAQVVKVSDELGLVFCWAFTSKSEGEPYYDLHGDNIDEDFIAAAAEFMERGGPTDEMHDSHPDGRVVFAMPMTAEIAAAFGVKSATSGLMVALKPSPEVLAKFKSGEYTAVSIAGAGERIQTSKRSDKIVKHNLATNEVDGHAHAIRVYEDGSMYVEHATMNGADYGHTHGLVTGPDGALQILADSGHTHELADGIPGVVIVHPDAIVVVQASAPARKSTQPATPSKGEPIMKIVVFTEAQHAHYSKLSGADADAFIAKSDADRNADIQKAKDADPVVFKTSAGIEVRKSDGALALALAKQADESAQQLAKATEIAKAEAAAREEVELAKRATETLGGLAGSDDAHKAIMKAVDGIADEKLRAEATTALKAARDAFMTKSTAKGAGGEGEPEVKNPQAEYDELVGKAMADHKVDRFKAADMVLTTKRGKELYAAINKASKSK